MGSLGGCTVRAVWVLGLLLDTADLSAVFVFSYSWKPVFIKGNWLEAGWTWREF